MTRTRKESLIVRADGIEIGSIHIGSQVVIHKAEEWRRDEVKQMRRQSHRGEWYTEDVTLRRRLIELAGHERGGQLYAAAQAAEVVQIADENLY